MNRRKFIRDTAVSATAVGFSAPAINAMAPERKKTVKRKVGLYSLFRL